MMKYVLDKVMPNVIFICLLLRCFLSWFFNIWRHIKRMLYGFVVTRRFFFIISNDITLDIKELYLKNTILPHPIGIVIGTGVVLGKGCTIYQNVTIGTKNGYGGYPRLGDDVILFSGCAVIGDVTIGNRVIVGANSVVMNDIPDDCLVVGCPAKVVKRFS